MSEVKRVLVLDDEEMILELVSDIFQLIGFDVASVTTGEAAIQEFKKAKEQGQPFNLVLFDMTLPGDMDGATVLKEIKKIDPNVKAIVSSGHSHEELKTKAGDGGFDAAVPKPYSINMLKETVNELLKE